MGSAKTSGKRWKTATMGLALVMVVALEALVLKLGWPQEPARPAIDDEMAKQEKIYWSHGAEVPAGYVTGRALSDYADLLSPGFCDALGSLSRSHRWLDIGAGDGQAILDYYAPDDEPAPAQRCARSAGRASAVAVSIEDRRTDKWQKRAARLEDGRMQYLSGKRLRQYSLEELGKFQIITDVYGGFSYTEDLSRFMETVLRLLEVDGVFYTLLQNVHLENAKDNTAAAYHQTELLDPDGRGVKVCSWLKKTACVKVVCESKSDWDSPSELIQVRKMCSDVSVPRMKLVHFHAGNPPARRFQLEP